MTGNKETFGEWLNLAARYARRGETSQAAHCANKALEFIAANPRYTPPEGCIVKARSYGIVLMLKNRGYDAQVRNGVVEVQDPVVVEYGGGRRVEFQPVILRSVLEANRFCEVRN